MPTVSINVPNVTFNSIRTKYINYGVQGRRETKVVIDKKKKLPYDEEMLDEMPEELVNIENDG